MAKETREDRLKRQLRENLKRRKAQARAKAEYKVERPAEATADGRESDGQRASAQHEMPEDDA